MLYLPIIYFQGPEIQRKNNFIINTGDNLTAKEREKRIKLNKQKYGLSQVEIKAMKLPKPVDARMDVILTIDQIFNAKSNFSVIEKLHHLDTLKTALETKLKKIQKQKQDIAMKKKYRSLN